MTFNYQHIHGHYFAIPVTYLMWATLSNPKEKAVRLAEKNGFQIRQGEIVEKDKMFGVGWIAVPVESVESNHPQLIKLDLDADVYEKPSQLSIQESIRQIWNKRPTAKHLLKAYKPQKNGFITQIWVI